MNILSMISSTHEYVISLENLKKLFANELNVPVNEISIRERTKTEDDYRESYSVFDGLIVTVNKKGQ